MAEQEFEELAETFEFLDDWEDRYRHVIDMGKVCRLWTLHFRSTRQKLMDAQAKFGCVP